MQGEAANWRSPRAPEPRPSFRSSSGDADDELSSPEEELLNIKDFVFGLPLPDKVAFLGSVATFAMTFFPWKVTITDGAQLGMLSLGFPVAPAAVLGILMVVVRARKALRRVDPLLLWVTQLAASAFGILWSLIFILVSWDGRMGRAPVGNYEMALSMPTVGVFIALAASGVALFGTLLGIRERLD